MKLFVQLAVSILQPARNLFGVPTAEERRTRVAQRGEKAASGRIATLCGKPDMQSVFLYFITSILMY